MLPRPRGADTMRPMDASDEAATGPDPAPTGDEAFVPFDPSTIRDPLPQPLFSVRRAVIAALLLVAVGCLVVAVQSGGGTDPADPVDAQAAIVAFTPTPGSRVIRQSTVGVMLEQGYDGRLTINGTAIPEEEMEGAIVPGSEAYEALSDEDRQKGPRPNNKEQVLYRPGPGKAVADLGTGEVQIVVRYWRVSEGEQTARTFPYSIYVV